MVENSSLIKDIFGAFISDIHQGLAVIDSAGILEICNLRFAEILGKDQVGLINRNISDLIPGFDEDCYGRERSLNLHPYQSISLKTLPVGNQTIGTFFLVILSEDEDQEREKTLFLNQAFETILDNIDEGVMVVDSKSRVVYCNRVQLEFDGLELETILGQPTPEIYNFDPESGTLWKCIKTEKYFGPYVQYYCSNYGQYIRVTGNNFPVKQGERTTGAVAIYRNLQESEEMVAKIINLQKRMNLEQSDYLSVLVSGSSAKERKFSFDDILGDSSRIRDSIFWAKGAAKSDSPVFIYGETGTGKEMFAQSIHCSSRRCQKPLVSINCAAIPETLLEGIIFGTVKGVFTGAVDRKGLFEEADGGTLFLDEINSMPLGLQSKLLRALEERKIRRLGGKNEIPVDVRIISTCNIEPLELIRQNLLRTDLYYRLAVINLEIPPLRARKEDINLLVRFFVKGFNMKMKKNICEISPDVFALLESHDWPGNVRQLKHWIESAMNMVPEDEPVFSKKYMPRNFKSFMGTISLNNEPIKQGEVFEEIKEQERARLINALKQHGGNITKTANELNISRQVLYYRLRKLGIK
ncbi:sigma-54-dependent Fis family transcriptional regulator [Desulfosporosinus youngiae]|uniref:PAS domain S-box n=1 Tax=Desulfosporosinus youngiae DSM 17734 TaxID=768710 RepID=H5XXH4_9FIRM|nr:sigma-54-dependent Fis family transcriptional regulator [Desulfosporosinus youngiae]EHQ91180.1 PAS domain S-box [Desulfosporosinus youngiae DSM 17734]